MYQDNFNDALLKHVRKEIEAEVESLCNMEGDHREDDFRRGKISALREVEIMVERTIPKMLNEA